MLRRAADGRLLLVLALCSAPLSISVTESLLGMALAVSIARVVGRRHAPPIPRVLWPWLGWAGLEVVVWLHSPDIRAGTGEIRHLLLVAALFVVLPAIDRPELAVAVWRGLFVTSAIGSGALVAGFIYRLLRYQHEIAAAADPSAYLRTGGLLHHWMVYGTVEVIVFAAMLEFWRCYPEERRWVAPAIAINVAAILLSLTRMLWLSCLLLLALHLVWRRSKWIWAVPALPLLLFSTPDFIRARLIESFEPDYYSNLERVEMWRVGWRMIREHPLAGVGPGRVNGLYVRYLSPGDPVPAFHGHLHDNLLQLAAEFGLPVAAAAAIFAAVLGRELVHRCKSASDRSAVFLSRTAVLGLTGFLVEGLFDYTYGHSLGLILLGFAVLWPTLRLPGPAASSRRPWSRPAPSSLA